jgi:hypothetical protein
MLSTIASCVLEALYQFSPGVLPDPYATLIVDSVVCAAQLPLVLLGLSAHGIVDKYWRNERATELNNLALAHAAVAGKELLVS